MDRHELLERIRLVLADMPAEQPPRGHVPNWGPPELGCKPRAFYLARVLGMDVSESCASCEADVYDRLLHELKIATPAP